MNFTHRTIGEQYIDSNYFDKVILKGAQEFPALILKSEKVMSKNTLRVLANCFDLSKGTSVYIYIGDQLQFIGRLEVNIDNLYRLYTLFNNIKLNVFYMESRDSEPKFLNYMDFIHTINLNVGGSLDV